MTEDKKREEYWDAPHRQPMKQPPDPTHISKELRAWMGEKSNKTPDSIRAAAEEMFKSVGYEYSDLDLCLVEPILRALVERTEGGVYGIINDHQHFDGNPVDKIRDRIREYFRRIRQGGA